MKSKTNYIEKIYNNGERYVPWHSGITRLEHYVRYYFALQVVGDKTVLDLACGEGYGSAILSERSKKVIGIDSDSEVVAHASNKYSGIKNISFTIGSTQAIPLEDNSIEIAISYETLEHVNEQDQMLAEIRRVLIPDGIIILSTPEQSNYMSHSEFENKHHVKELTIQELMKLMARYFKNTVYYKQFVTVSSTIIPQSIHNGGRTVIDSEDPYFADKQVYNIVVGSNGEIPEMETISLQSARECEKLLLKEKEIYRSKTYRLGSFLTGPYRLIRDVFKRK